MKKRMEPSRSGLSLRSKPRGKRWLFEATSLGSALAACSALVYAQASPAEQQLPEVKVRAGEERPTELPRPYAGGQTARGGRLGLLGNADVMTAPFSIMSYTAQMIENQQARHLWDVLVNDPSVRLSSAQRNINEDFSIRGFPVASQDAALNGMYGLMPHFRVPVEMAERVEVLKGPSALLNGMPPSGNIGGAINLVPKRAGLEPLARLTIGYESESIFGAHADVGRRFGTSREIGLRVNAAYRKGDTPLDEQTQNDSVGAVALDYAGERVRFSLDFIGQKQDIDRVVRQFQAGPGLTRIPDAPDSSLNYPGFGRSKTHDYSGVVRGEFDVSDAVTAYGGFGWRKHHMDAVAGNPTLLNAAGDFTSIPAWQLFEVDSISAEAGVHMRFTTGAIRHRVSLGATKVDQDSYIFFLFPGLAPARNSNIFNPIYSDTPNTAGIPSPVNKFSESTLTSYAVADTLSFFNETLLLTLGARHQTVEAQAYAIGSGAPTGPRYDKHAVTPVAGVVVKPLERVAVYANYIEGLSQGPTAPLAATNAGEIFAPFISRQTEVGVKVDWGTFTTALDVFQIRQPSAFLQSGVFGVNGEQRNRGIEFNVFGEVVSGVRLLGGATYMRGELTKNANPALEGNYAIGVPRVTVNLGSEWDVPGLPGFTLTGRVIHTGRMYVDQANVLPLPTWTRFDVGARYATRIGGKPVTFRASLENAFDKSYWGVSNAGFMYVGGPRTLLVSTAIDF